MKLRDDAIVEFEVDAHERPIRPGKRRIAARRAGIKVVLRPFRPRQFVLVEHTVSPVLLMVDVGRAVEPRALEHFMRAALAPKGTNP